MNMNKEITNFEHKIGRFYCIMTCGLLTNRFSNLVLILHYYWRIDHFGIKYDIRLEWFYVNA